MEIINHPPFDAVIPYHEKDCDILPYCLEAIRRNLSGLRNIYIVSCEKPEVDEDITWIPESHFSFTIEDVGRKIPYNRRGWYYQQLLKLYIHEVVPELLEHYLILDSDVVIIRPISFFKEGKILFDYGGIYNEPYVKHMKSVLPDIFKNVPDYCGVTDHMMFRKDIICDMKKRVEEVHQKELWKALLEHVEPVDYHGSGMSEYNFYFHYALIQYPAAYELRLLKKTMGKYIAEIINHSDMDFICFHAWYRDNK